MTQTNQEPTLSETTGTRAGTSEQGALKTIHRGYNKLNGYEAMLHIINRYRYVLYPFILMSIAGSTYSFFNDFIVAFPMLGNTANFFFALFYSVMLEVVRDGSIIAIFNSKMKPLSRGVVITIFLVVTAYMYNSHLKAIDVIERNAVEYTLAHQTVEEQSIRSPRLEMVQGNLERVQKRLVSTEEERAKQLDISANAKYRVNKVNAQKQLPILDIKIEKLQIQAYQVELLKLKNDNITEVKDNQKIISAILLATLLLTESLAMLGAVIKFINKDNADKEVAKHGEIIEEYESISEQMRKTNDELGLMLSRDIESAGNQNVAFIHAMAENRQMFQSQMNEVLQLMASSQPLSFNMPMPQVQAKREELTEEPKRQIGFSVTDTKESMIQALYADGAISVGNKLTPKSSIVNTKKRQENQRATNYYKEFERLGIIENRGLGRNGGYYAVADYKTALDTIREV